MLLILNVGGQTSMLIATALHGLTIGAYITLQNLMVADYFGRSHLGAISGIMRPFMTGAGAVSPLLIAFLFDLQDSYTMAFLIIASAWTVAGCLMLLAAPPKKQAGPETAPGGLAPDPAGVGASSSPLTGPSRASGQAQVERDRPRLSGFPPPQERRAFSRPRKRSRFML